MADMLPLRDPRLRYEAVLACGQEESCPDLRAACRWLWDQAKGPWGWSARARRPPSWEAGAVPHTVRLERQDDMAMFVLAHRAHQVPLGHSRWTERDRTVHLQRSADEAEHILSSLRATASDGPIEFSLHPGQHVRLDCLEPLGLSVAAAAKMLGVSRTKLASLVAGKTGIDWPMAMRLAAAFGGSSAMWLGLQAGFEVARVRRGEALPF